MGGFLEAGQSKNSRTISTSSCEGGRLKHVPLRSILVPSLSPSSELEKRVDAWLAAITL